MLITLALGAKFVFIRRPFLLAAAVGSKPGVSHAIDLLTNEIDRDMALLGLHRLDEAGPHMLMAITPSAAASP